MKLISTVALIGTAVSELDTVRAFNAAGFLRQAWETQTRWIQGLRQRIAAKQGWVQTFTQSVTAMMSITVVAVGALLILPISLSLEHARIIGGLGFFVVGVSVIFSAAQRTSV